MKSPVSVVADTTPLNYLILIGQIGILGEIFGEVFISEAVLRELKDRRAPEAVQSWAGALPPWAKAVQVRNMDPSIRMGAGEVEAISLAVEAGAHIVLMDERRGRAAAAARGLRAIGTLNLIDLADERGLVDGLRSLNELKKTTFRADARLMERFEEKLAARHREGRI